MNKVKPILGVLVILAVVGGIAALLLTGKKGHRVAIGTGSETGVYYPTGGAIAKLFNASDGAGDYTMDVTTSGGSVVNINSVISDAEDAYEFGIAQTDRVYQAVQGRNKWQDKPAGKLRALFSLHPEMVTLIATEDSGIRSVADLKGKRVSLGTPGSGQEGNALDVLTIAGLGRQDVVEQNLSPGDFAGMLQDGRVDAVFYTVGHPNGAVTQITNGRVRKVRIIPIQPSDEWLTERPYYSRGTIDVQAYPKALNDQPVETIQVRAMVISASDVPEDLVYQVTKAVFTSLDTFRNQHPALSELTREGMARGMTAPLHAGARRYFTEAGLLDD
jgi:hypothetical protein